MIDIAMYKDGVTGGWRKLLDRNRNVQGWSDNRLEKVSRQDAS
jgi:hypothetical protein